MFMAFAFVWCELGWHVPELAKGVSERTPMPVTSSSGACHMSHRGYKYGSGGSETFEIVAA